MNRNDILRRIRFIFDFNDDKMMKIFEQGGLTVSRALLSNWLKRESDPEFVVCSENQLSMFLNGFITVKRGKQDNPNAKPHLLLNNNTILMKMRIALNLRTEDIVDVMESVDLKFGKSEINAFFRKPDHKNYRDCKDQMLRNFLYGLQLKYRPESINDKDAPGNDDEE